MGSSRYGKRKAFLGVDDVARMFGVSQADIRERLWDDEMPGYRVARTWFVLRVDIDGSDATSRVDAIDAILAGWPDPLVLSEAALFFGVPKPQVRGWVTKGIIPARRSDAGWVIYHLAVRETFLAARNGAKQLRTSVDKPWLQRTLRELDFDEPAHSSDSRAHVSAMASPVILRDVDAHGRDQDRGAHNDRARRYY